MVVNPQAADTVPRGELESAVFKYADGRTVILQGESLQAWYGLYLTLILTHVSMLQARAAEDLDGDVEEPRASLLDLANRQPAND